MLYSEWLEGSGLTATEENYKIYQRVNDVYMTSELSKNEVYALTRALMADQVQDNMLFDMLESVRRMNHVISDYYEQAHILGMPSDIEGHLMMSMNRLADLAEVINRHVAR